MKKFLKKLFKNYKVKLFMLFIALLIWLHAATEQIYEYDFKVEIVPVNVAPGLIVANDYPRYATVTFQGKGKALFALKNAKRSIMINLSEYRFRGIFRLRKEDVQIRPSILNVKPIRIVEPDTVVIELDRLVKKSVAVKSKIVVQPAPGYTIVGGIVLKPDKVLVQGPRRVVKKISSIETQKVILEHVTQDIAETVPLDVKQFKRLEVIPEEVHYYVDVQKLGEKIIEDVPVQLINVPRGAKVKILPSVLTIKIEGGVEILNKITRDDILAYIDFKRQFRKGVTSYPATIKLPPGLRFSEVYPSTFKITMER